MHCECALVSSLESSGLPPVFSYVGVSKLSCKQCHNWLKSYNSVTGKRFRTRGLHDRFFPGWARPALEHDDTQANVDALLRRSSARNFATRASQELGAPRTILLQAKQ